MSVLAAFLLCSSIGINSTMAGDADEVLAAAEKIENKEQPFAIEIRIKGDKSNFSVGDEVDFIFKTDKDCYLTLIDIGTSGKTSIIFPNEWHKSNKIQAGKEYQVPSAESDFHFKVEGPTGKLELVKAIASLEPIEIKAKVAERGPFKVIRNAKLVLKDLSAELKTRDSKEWSTSTVSFYIEEGDQGDSSPDAQDGEESKPDAGRSPDDTGQESKQDLDKDKEKPDAGEAKAVGDEKSKPDSDKPAAAEGKDSKEAGVVNGNN